MRRARPTIGALVLALVGASCAAAAAGPAVSLVGSVEDGRAPPGPADVEVSDVRPAPNRVPWALRDLLSALPAERRSFTLAFTGDTLAHTPTWDQALRYGNGVVHDFTPMFTRVAPIVSAVDLAVCHLETPIAPAGERYSTYPMYGVPAELAAGLASAGYDRCSTASNHTIDRGTAGVDATVDALAAVGISQSGMARTPEEAATPPVFDVQDVRVAHLSYTWSFNGLRLPAGEPWRSNLIDANRIVADATTARASGAEYVIVSLHWGVEGSSAVSPYQRDVAERITAAGVVDLVVGHHAHVLQPIEQVNGRWVLFGLGNFLSSMTTASWPAEVQDGAIAVVVVSERSSGFVTAPPVVLPTFVDRHPYVIRPVLQDLADPAVAEPVKDALRASLERTRRIVGEYVPAA